MELTKLMSLIDEIDQIGNQTWLDSLNSRKLTELEFHNRDRNQSYVKEATKNADTYECFMVKKVL